MKSCKDLLMETFLVFLGQESEGVLDLVAETLSRLVREERVKTSMFRGSPLGMDALLTLDEWRLAYPIGGSPTKAWEDVSQLLVSSRELTLTAPPWVSTLIRVTCARETLDIPESIRLFFYKEGNPAASKMPSFLLKMAHHTHPTLIDAASINRLLRDIPLGIPADTLIAQLKNYGFISPHLRADFFRMQTPHYEVHPLLLWAAHHQKEPLKGKPHENPNPFNHL